MSSTASRFGICPWRSAAVESRRGSPWCALPVSATAVRTSCPAVSGHGSRRPGRSSIRRKSWSSTPSTPAWLPAMRSSSTAVADRWSCSRTRKARPTRATSAGGGCVLPGGPSRFLTFRRHNRIDRNFKETRDGGGNDMGDRLKRMAGARKTVTGLSLVLLLAACGGTPSNPGPAAAQPPTAGMKPPPSVGAGEGQLNLIAWEGYAEKDWVQPFQQQTGCQVNAKYAGSSDEMVTLMANGGGGQYDMVSASGDADLRLIYGGDVKPVNVNLVPDYTNFQAQFKSLSFNTINGIHYVVSLQWR